MAKVCPSDLFYNGLEVREISVVNIQSIKQKNKKMYAVTTKKLL